MPKTPEPRTNIRMGRIYPPLKIGATWLESEIFCHSQKAYDRRAYVRLPDGRMRVVRCRIGDGFSSVPAKYTDKGKTVKGFIMTDDEAIKFHLAGEV